VNPSGDWNSSSSWSPNGVPTAGDTVTIASGDTITVTNSHDAASVTVNGTLQIQNGGLLSVDDVTVASGGSLQINGTGAPYAELVFPAGSASPTLAVNQANGVDLVDNARIKVGLSMSFTGSGSIRGQDDASCEIAIGDEATAANVTLTLQVPLRGELDIVGIGRGDGHNDTFANQSVVDANASGAITLGASLEAISDNDAGDCVYVWLANASGGTLQFDRGSTSLVGDFRIVSGATMTVNNNVTTSGKYKNSGTINGSASFVASGGTCP